MSSTCTNKCTIFQIVLTFVEWMWGIETIKLIKTLSCVLAVRSQILLVFFLQKYSIDSNLQSLAKHLSNSSSIRLVLLITLKKECLGYYLAQEVLKFVGSWHNVDANTVRFWCLGRKVGSLCFIHHFWTLSTRYFLSSLSSRGVHLSHNRFNVFNRKWLLRPHDLELQRDGHSWMWRADVSLQPIPFSDETTHHHWSKDTMFFD